MRYEIKINRLRMSAGKPTGGGLHTSAHEITVTVEEEGTQNKLYYSYIIRDNYKKGGTSHNKIMDSLQHIVDAITPSLRGPDTEKKSDIIEYDTWPTPQQVNENLVVRIKAIATCDHELYARKKNPTEKPERGDLFAKENWKPENLLASTEPSQKIGRLIGCISGMLLAYFPVTATYQAISNALPGEGGEYLGGFLALCLALLLTYIGTKLGIFVDRSLEKCCKHDTEESVTKTRNYNYSAL